VKTTKINNFPCYTVPVGNTKINLCT